MSWKKVDRETFFTFVANFIRASDQSHEHVRRLKPIIEVFKNASVATDQKARMRHKERNTLQNFELWVGDISRLIDTLKELKITWSPGEFFEVARDHSPVTASRFKLLAAQVNGFLDAHTEEIRDVLFQVGFALRQCTMKFGANDQEKLDEILTSITEHINSDNFSRLSLAVQVLHRFADHQENRSKNAFAKK